MGEETTNKKSEEIPVFGIFLSCCLGGVYFQTCFSAISGLRPETYFLAGRLDCNLSGQLAQLV